MSTGEYYKKTLVNDHNMNMYLFNENWIKKLKDNDTDEKVIKYFQCGIRKDFTTSKSIEAYGSFVNSNYDLISNYNTISPKRKWLYKSYKAKKTYLSSLIDTFFKDTVVGYGNYSPKSECYIPGRRGPITFIKRLLVTKSVPVIKIDEYYTSKKCHRCHSVLGNFNSKTQKASFYSEDVSVPFSKMKICSNCKNKKGDLSKIHRDRNGSFNIAVKLVRLLKKQEIPEALVNKSTPN